MRWSPKSHNSPGRPPRETELRSSIARRWSWVIVERISPQSEKTLGAGRQEANLIFQQGRIFGQRFTNLTSSTSLLMIVSETNRGVSAGAPEAYHSSVKKASQAAVLPMELSSKGKGGGCSGGHFFTSASQKQRNNCSSSDMGKSN